MVCCYTGMHTSGLMMAGPGCCAICLVDASLSGLELSVCQICNP